MKDTNADTDITAANASMAQEDNLQATCPGVRRTFQEALDEVQREFNVRERCFPKWVKEGRMSSSDSTDRLERLAAALYFLRALSYGDLAGCVEAMDAVDAQEMKLRKAGL
jgi:hypothetical protein